MHTITNTLGSFYDSGSLSEAVSLANLSPDPDLIVFNIPGGGVKTITPVYLDIHTPVFIDGTTQPGYSGTPVIEVRFGRFKISSGADLIITQLFFNNADFFAFEKKMREKKITVPIIPGIMPITNFNQIVKFTQMCGAKIPEKIYRDLDPIKDNLDAVQKYGIDYATIQCRELISRGVPGIHFYTLNRSKSTKTIIENLRKELKIK